MESGRSGCPINLSLEVFGDRWSLIVIRDMMFGNRRHFREILTRSDEGIASNVLADRLLRLVELGMITRAPDRTHKQKVLYSLAEPAIQLVPVLAHLGAWGVRHLPVSRELSVRAELLERGGPEFWERFMDELREQHLGIARQPGQPSPFDELRAAFEVEVARGAESAPPLRSRGA